MTAPIDIASRRELFVDDFLIDTANTTAAMKLHQPIAREVVCVHDEPWEGDGCDFYNIVKEDDFYRMYYLSWRMLDRDVTGHSTKSIVVAYMESRDGLTWEKPNLGLCEVGGSKDNNVILGSSIQSFDGFYVFKDPNPNCPANERYKGVTVFKNPRELVCFVSGDGIHFEKGWTITDKGKFDTLNIAFWDAPNERYLCYIRNFHHPNGDDPKQGDTMNLLIRDVRWLESKDFKTWSDPVLLDFGDSDDVPLYTNVAQPYHRAEQLLIGFPSRYIERKEWSPSFDDLPNAEYRKKLCAVHPRYGLALTDCCFMSSRDGAKWHRFDEAFMTPGPQRDKTWVYGDCFPAVGLIETPSDLPGAPDELSMYTFDYHWSNGATHLRRHTLRMDGFVSRNGPYKGAKLTSKPFVFAGSELSINFATSAAGHMRIKLIGESKTLTSCEIFGDSIDRKVVFEDGKVSELAGQPVTMQVELKDADIYSFVFE